MRKYKLDLTYFEKINTPKKAYWLGYIFADGGIKKDWLLQLYSVDKNIIQKFKKDLKTKKPIYKDRNYFVLQIYSKKMISDIVKLGVVHNKWNKLIFPKFLNPKLYKHFIRGFFDGDGCISYYRCNNRWQLQFNITTGSKTFLCVIKSILEKALKLNKHNRLNKNGNAYRLNYAKETNLQRIYDYLYQNNILYLKRKKDKFKKGLQLLKTNKG